MSGPTNMKDIVGIKLKNWFSITTLFRFTSQFRAALKNILKNINEYSTCRVNFDTYNTFYRSVYQICLHYSFMLESKKTVNSNLAGHSFLCIVVVHLNCLWDETCSSVRGTRQIEMNPKLSFSKRKKNHSATKLSEKILILGARPSICRIDKKNEKERDISIESVRC